jgi:hypothetical protein
MSLHDLPHSDPVQEAQHQLRQNAIAIDRHNHIPHKQTPPPVHHGHPGAADNPAQAAQANPLAPSPDKPA